MTIATPRHHKYRPHFAARIATAVTARKTVIFGGAALTIPATATGSLTTPAQAAPAPVKAAPGVIVKAEPTAPAPSSVVTVRYGSTGDYVKVVQQRLSVRVDGVFGAETLRAVRSFQAQKSLVVDGIVGANTWRALGGFPAGTTPAPTTPTTPTPTTPAAGTTVQFGSTGELVKVVQQRLSVRVDGVFGAETLRAVRAFQAQKSLVVDGIVGANTWRALGGFPAGTTPAPTTPTPTTPPPAPTTPTPPTPAPNCEVTTLRFGSTGVLVNALQQRLGNGVIGDGVFGAATLEAVRALQASKGLPVTGVVDLATWNALGGFPCDTVTPTPRPAGDVPYNAVLGQRIVDTAKQYLGVPYVWGGSTPAGFDCSGLTSYVYAKVGLSIPRTARAQQAYVTPVSKPQPGDLVFFGTPAYHVGIWVSENEILAAPYPGQVVRITPFWVTPTGFGRVVS